VILFLANLWDFRAAKSNATRREKSRHEVKVVCMACLSYLLFIPTLFSRLVFLHSGCL
jgi:hypothetical protein